MKPLNKILTGILCGAIVFGNAFAGDDCSNIKYKQSHPERCKYTTATTSNNTLLYVGGGAIAAGGITALVAALAGGGASGGGNGSVPPSSAQHIRVLTPTMISRNGVAPDFAGADLASITSMRDYKRNASAYDDIQLAYSIARGYTGLGTTIAVFDTDASVPMAHGAAVSEIAHGIIAPDAVVKNYTIAYNAKDFKSYNEIGNIISNVNDANVYNNSWNVSAVTADKITSRAQFAARTSHTFVNAITNAAAEKDAVLVWAAGNDGGAQSGMLSAAPRVIPELNGHFVNVVAWDSNTQSLAEYSNACGVTQDFCITAPGTIKASNGYTHVGTSFAAPVVSAAIAVLRQAWPYLSATQITDILLTTAADLGDPGVDEIYGHGMLDMENATRPVGNLSIATENSATPQPLQTARVSAGIAHNIKSANPTMAFFDEYGRAYETKISNNISIRNRGLGFERMRGNPRASVNMGNIEFGFYNSDIFNGTGFLGTDGNAPTSYIATNHTWDMAGIKMFAQSMFGTTRPTASSESMITEFSNIYTASASFGVRGTQWAFSVGIPETIVHGDMNLNTATGRRSDGTMIFQNYKIDMATKPAIEYSANYRFLTAGFVDNPYGDDEFYIFAKSKINF